MLQAVLDPTLITELHHYSYYTSQNWVLINFQPVCPSYEGILCEYNNFKQHSKTADWLLCNYIDFKQANKTVMRLIKLVFNIYLNRLKWNIFHLPHM